MTQVKLSIFLNVAFLLLTKSFGENTTTSSTSTAQSSIETTISTTAHQQIHTTTHRQIPAAVPQLPQLTPTPQSYPSIVSDIQTSPTESTSATTVTSGFSASTMATLPPPLYISNYSTIPQIPTYPSSPILTKQESTLDTISVDVEIGPGGPDQKESLGIQKAIDWLREKRLPDYSWGNDTHMVILAKELSGARDPTDSDNHIQEISDLENMLSIKQMEIEVLTMVDRHHALPKPVNTDRIAKYILAMGALCKDARHFYGHDLVATLEHHEHDQGQEYEFALTALAVCSSATHVRKRQIRRLLDIASGEVNNVDTIAMVLLALRCIVTDHRHRHLQHFVRRPARGLASLQGPQGSFGSLRSTALAMQALQDLEPDPAGKWNRTAASEWLLSKQRIDGGWTEEPLQDGQDPTIGVGLTADIILALGWKGLGAVRALQCDLVVRESNENGYENGDQKIADPVRLGPTVEEEGPRNVSYTYTLWVGTNETEEYSLDLTSPKNTTFFRAMKQASEIDPRFSFEAREWPNGHYVHTLAGMKEEPKSYHYWLLYRLPERPDTKNPPGNQLIAPLGVDELLVEDGEHYLYWYKKL
ncbi:uncharacterized protein CG3556 [Uranotaenia lowii]|uniref:uncharacterized protein CG3556 n=1 Tax=Uranotaenia lowii TaxID=190385 RepID=UPI002479B8BB|nr:uncharacterized protein CG3556 [Uranotaenia lowii]XP_055595265.1 uncharacterized protein CG3556 [Uranotaenia lowii]XP_055595266.1 uncharacterized protein CG3556 [Uranotaenia lowii]XP_055595267.1 uncharacterized protein CG3556 [Uranotaenia lowii]XP_055595268.1 uncharacterized protein CG3556 [Uranotaenia lowii]XP_055595269.1 uncharacterized protein CG3556 [Uranotaenia lowii]XP_055595270.1 uncharacterized protein CG3556 [Uranotaenia lowii]XP_055595271.1 uncharacterized protein CG3556 [Uranot